MWDANLTTVRGRGFLRGVLLAAAVLNSCSAGAAAYTPSSDDEVLERLPAGLRSSQWRQDRAALADDPENLSDSVSMARSYLETARTEGDSRFLGYAQSILAPWWNQSSPPVDVRMIRAEVFASAFEFDRAMAEMEAVLASEPAHGPALAGRIEVFLARGDVDGARRAFDLAKTTMTPRAAVWVLSRCDRVSPRLPEAVASAERLVSEMGSETGVGERYTMLAWLAELQMQQGRWNEASARFAALRPLGKRDVRVLALEADGLLDHGRPEDVVERLKGETAHDGLAVRLLDAWIRRGKVDEAEAARRDDVRRQVEKRLSDRRARGDASALPEEVRYWVRVQPDGTKAVACAEELWSVRRTLEDARWIVEAARLGNHAALQKAVTDWMTRLGVQDARLEAALRRSEGRP